MTEVKLVSYTQPNLNYFSNNELDINDLNDDLQNIIAYTARVSNPSNQMNMETSKKLIQYMMKNHHWSPFEMVNVCLEINTTRDIAHQILRHRSFSFQEFSQRYADPTKDMKFETHKPRLQDSKNRQNSLDTADGDVQYGWYTWQENILDQVKQAYAWAIENGIAKELARKILPEGMTGTRIYMNGSIRSWIHYIQIRSDPSTQKEHREVALLAADAIEPIFPLIKEI